jgi:pimeloyl-ACP methyl ester carboxylesterase
MQDHNFYKLDMTEQRPLTEQINGDLKMESLMVPVNSTDNLHLKHIYINPDGPPIFMLHGSVENGRMFYSNTGSSGLGPYLAKYGYDVYVGDLRGRGESKPHVSRNSKYGQTEAITEDIPAFIEKIISLRGNTPQRWVCHSWGGVLTSSHLLRFPKYRDLVKSMVYFGSKRRVSAINPTRIFQIDIVYTFLGSLLVRKHGYFPSSRFMSEDEPALTRKGTAIWIRMKDWVDPFDGFNYGKAAQDVVLPPTLYFAALNDQCLGHRKDVLLTINESGKHVSKYVLLGKKCGNLHDYDHVTMLTHKDAVKDHFPMVVAWLAKY